MQTLRTLVFLVSVGSASVTWATLGDPPPANPCPSLAEFKPSLGVLAVSGDGSPVPNCDNFVLAETAIMCTSKERAGKPVDIAIEYFDAGGNQISGPLVVGTNAFCSAAPGATFTFHTRPPAAGAMPLPWSAPGTVPGFVPTTPVVSNAPCTFGVTGCFLHGSARVLATSKKVECTAVRIDMLELCQFGFGDVATKNLTIIRATKQQGD